MSLSDPTTSITYDCDGLTVEFTIPFEYMQNDHVKVEHFDGTTETTETLIYGSEYAVSGTLATMVATYPAGDKLAVYRETERTQETELIENSEISSAVVEKVFDKGTMIDQETAGAMSLTIRAPASDGVLNELVSAARRKGLFLMFNSLTGQPQAAAVYESSLVVASFMEALLESSDLDEFRGLGELYTWYYGTTSPAASIGINGDYYIDTVTHIIYGPKTAGAWSSLVDLSEWEGSRRFISTSSPTSGDGDNGDFWFQHDA